MFFLKGGDVIIRLGTTVLNDPFHKKKCILIFKGIWIIFIPGGGSLGLLPLTDSGRKNKTTLPMIHGHSDLVTDFDFSPFDDSLLATCSSDTTVSQIIWFF